MLLERTPTTVTWERSTSNSWPSYLHKSLGRKVSTSNSCLSVIDEDDSFYLHQSLGRKVSNLLFHSLC